MTTFLTVEQSAHLVEYSTNGTVIISNAYNRIPIEVLELPSSTVTELLDACSNIEQSFSYLYDSFTSYRYLCTIKYKDYTVYCNTRDIVPAHIKTIMNITTSLLE